MYIKQRVRGERVRDLRVALWRIGPLLARLAGRAQMCKSPWMLLGSWCKAPLGPIVSACALERIGRRCVASGGVRVSAGRTVRQVIVSDGSQPDTTVWTPRWWR